MAERTATQNIKVKLTGAAQAEAQFKSLGSSVAGTVAKYISITGAAYALGQQFKKGIQGALEEERIMRKLEHAINLTGRSYENVKYDIKSYLDQLQKTTIYSDDEAAGALSNLVQLTGNYATALKLLPTVLNMAAAGLTDLDSAAKYVAMANEGNIEILGRMLPQFRGTNIEFLKHASSAEKAQWAMNELNKITSRYAEEGLKSLEGRIKQAQKQWDESWEQMGMAALEAWGKIQEFSDRLFAFSSKLGEELGLHAAPIVGAVQGMRGIGESIRGIGIASDIALTPYQKFVQELEKDAAASRQKAQWTAQYWAATVGKGIGIAGTDTIQRQTAQLGKSGEQAMIAVGKGAENAKTTFEQLLPVTQQLDSVFQQVFTESFVRGKSFIESFRDSFIGAIEQMAATLAAKAATFGILNFLSGGAFGIGTSLANFLGFQHGGSFTVGGRGGSDSQLVAFRATPGERVIVQPHVTNNFNGYGSKEMTRTILSTMNKVSRGVAV